MATVPLTLMTVHAHPDDESIGTGGILAKYALEGIRTVLVTCTRGELGEVQDPSYAPPRQGMGITEIREQELAEAIAILNISAYYNLGYKDSGMAGTSGNNDPEAFARADQREAANCLARVIRKERPQVIVTYDENGIYGHPDHIMAHHITEKAFFAAGDPNLTFDSGEAPWLPGKLYYFAISMGRSKRNKSPQEDTPANARTASTIIGTPEEEITTRIDVTSVLDVKFNAIYSHASQIGPGHLFRRLSQDQKVAFFGKEHFVCAHGCDRVPNPKETDLFEGLG